MMSVDVGAVGRSRQQAWSLPPAWRSIIRPLVGFAACLVLALLMASAASAPLRAQTNPASFAGLELASTPAATKAIGQSGPAPLVEIATTSSVTNADAVFRRTSNDAAWTLLGLAWSILAVLNIAIFRHLRRNYAPSRCPAAQKQAYPPHGGCNTIELPQSRL
jgi:hypothetical protein